MKEKQFDISGMSCAACSSSVERVTRKIPGVTRSDVNLTTNKMTIEFDESLVTEELIIQKVEKAGFGCSYTAPKKRSRFTKKTLTFSWIFSGVLLYISMGHMIPGLEHGLPLPSFLHMEHHPLAFALAQLICTVPVLIIGRSFFTGGIKSLFRGNPNMDSLVAIGSGFSFVYSLVITFLIPSNSSHVHHLYYESAALVITFIMTGKYLENQSKEKTKETISKLLKLAPLEAALVTSDGIKIVPVSQISVGDTVEVKPGQSIPIDGKVIRGESVVDESMLTGESLPVDKMAGSLVTGGSINGNGLLHVQATSIGKDTTLAKIVALVEEAQGKKAPISQIADKVAGVFVPLVMLFALVAGIGWAFVGKDFSFILRIVTSVLVIACPCALGLATPAAIMTGTGLGASKGILIRSGEALEKACHVDTVVLDKTGTVTEGKPEVLSVRSLSPDFLSYTMALEKTSTHPLGKAVLKYGLAQQITEEDCPVFSKVENYGGKGIKGVINNTDTLVLVGNKRFMEENKVDCSSVLDFVESEQEKGGTMIFTSANGILLGALSISDTIKKDSEAAVKQLKRMGLDIILLTGDNKQSALYTAKKVGIDTVISDVLPQDKEKIISDLQEQGHKVMMVGDGINDAPALVSAYVGVAMGKGSDIAIESGDVVLMNSQLSSVSRTINLSRLTIGNIKQNLFWAFFYNIISIPIAAGVLYPTFGILLSPMIAGFAMSLSSVSVVTNALRLRTKKLDTKK
jgi:Cu+-exporting ATPase